MPACVFQWKHVLSPKTVDFEAWTDWNIPEETPESHGDHRGTIHTHLLRTECSCFPALEQCGEVED